MTPGGMISEDPAAKTLFPRHLPPRLRTGGCHSQPVGVARHELTDNRTSYTAIGGVGLLVGTIFYYMTTRPNKATYMKEKAQAAQTDAMNSVKDAAKNVRG
jgi:hypothetical protein